MILNALCGFRVEVFVDPARKQKILSSVQCGGSVNIWFMKMISVVALLILNLFFLLSKSFKMRPTPQRMISKTYLMPEGSGNPCKIKVIGVGGGGGNAVNRMMESSLGVAGVEFWIVNTDIQALSRSIVPQKLKIGEMTSRFLVMKEV